MKPLFILLEQSLARPVITIIVLLLVAAIIGYLTAWYYSRSVYVPVINGLEADKTELNKQIAGLKDDIETLNGKVKKLNELIGTLEKALVEKNKEIAKKDKEIEDLKKPTK